MKFMTGYEHCAKLASDIWSSRLLQGQEQLDVGVAGYGLGDGELAELHARLATAARAQLVTHAQEAANTALSRVKER